MANWATTDYVIEGPRETLQKIHQAIINPDKSEGDEGWEEAVLKALGIKWDDKKYMRGFIQETSDIPFNPNEDKVLKFYAQEAWGATDFNEVLEENFPDIKVYYSVEEEGEEVYATNDKEGKYFPYRYYVDTCIDGDYDSDYFTYESDAFKWLYQRTSGRVNSWDKVEEFNSDYEDSEAPEENYINIYKFEVIE